MENTDKAVDYVIYLDSFALSLKVEVLRPHTISCYVRDARRLVNKRNLALREI